jgi:hypothetical protein
MQMIEIEPLSHRTLLEAGTPEAIGVDRVNPISRMYAAMK